MWSRRTGRTGRIAQTSKGCRQSTRRRLQLDLLRLESREVLSTVSPIAEIQSVPSPAVLKAVPLPILRASAEQPFHGTVASVITNLPVTTESLNATVDWGDGVLSEATIEPNPWGGFNVVGNHRYPGSIMGPLWVRVNVSEAATDRWLFGAEQRIWVTRPQPTPQTFAAQSMLNQFNYSEPANRPQPYRLQLVNRRQQFQDASARHADGTATEDDRRLLRNVLAYVEEQQKGFWEELGDSFTDSLFFT